MNVKLVMAKGSAKGHTIVLNEDTAVVGRTKQCKVRIPSADVSRRHCVLSCEGGYVYVEDLGSTNGTFINGEQVNGKQVVQPGDLLEIGPVTFVVRYEAPKGVVEELPVVEALDTGENFIAEKTTESESLRGGRKAKREEPLPLDGLEVLEELAEVEAIEDVEVVEEVEEVVGDVEEVVDVGFNVEEESLHLPKDEDFRDLLSGLDGK